MDSRHFDDTVVGLYRAAAGQARFDDAFNRVTDALDLRGCQMIGMDASSGAITFSYANADAPSEAELEYVRSYHRVDPRIPLLLKRDPGDWLYCEDVIGEEEALSQPYYRDLLIPYGGRHSALVKLQQDERSVTAIAFLSKLGDEGFTHNRREYLQRIGRHLREALDINRHVRSLATGHAVGLELIERLRKPAWVIDDRLELLGSNALAAQLQQAEGALRESGGRLMMAASDHANDLAAAVRGLVLRQSRGETSPRCYVKLPRAGAASVSLFEPRDTMQLFGDVRRFLVMLHEPHNAPEPDLYLWQVAFDLTPAEARACQMIYGGATLKEGAQQLGVSVHTVNSQLDAAYAKVGVNSKVDLVQRLRSLD